MSSQSISKIDHANHLLLDQSLIRLPSELIHKNLRSARFTVEKDGTHIKSLLKETATSSMNGKLATTDDVLKNMDAMIARARGIKRKLTAYAVEEATQYDNLDKRLKQLSKLADMHTLDDVKYEVWSRQRLDRLIVDHMLRYGYLEGAKALVEERNLQGLVDVGVFADCAKIRQGLLDGSVKEALDWCSENKKELRKAESTLEFQIRLQQYIELARTRDPTKLHEAIIFARKHLLPYRETFPREYGLAGSLLAVSPHTSTKPGHKQEADDVVALYQQSRWTMLAELFTTSYYSLLNLPHIPLLNVALQPGLSALKTPACHASKNSSSAATSGPDGNASLCPICSTELNDLAKSVPYAHHSVSHVDADLVMLPNGRAYGREKVEEFAIRSGLLPAVHVKDPVTGEVFQASKLKKVFIT